MKKMSISLKERIISGCIGAAIMLMLLAGIYGVQNGVGSGLGDGKIAGISKGTIIATAKHYVKEELKSPSTAKFCPQNEIKIYEASDGISVYGYVDAENSFGAKVRNNFTVNLTLDAKKLKDVTFY